MSFHGTKILETKMPIFPLYFWASSFVKKKESKGWSYLEVVYLRQKHLLGGTVHPKNNMKKRLFWNIILPRWNYCVVGQYKTQEKNGFRFRHRLPCLKLIFILQRNLPKIQRKYWHFSFLEIFQYFVLVNWFLIT